MSRERTLIGLLLVAVVLAYSNHFHNSFHFDDSHAVETNASIRSLRNIPSMFRDGRTFSSLPTNQSYRPLTTASLAVDYWLAGGLRPFFFQLSTFVWFVGQLLLMRVLFRSALRETRAPGGSFASLLAVAWYGLHPAIAETVNYVIQRSEVQATVGVLAGLCLWVGAPRWRRTGLYLLPVAIGTLGKPTAIMFAPILTLFVLLFEQQLGFDFWRVSDGPKRALRAAWTSLPAWLACGALYLFQRVMTPPSFSTGASLAVRYWLTQPYVQLQYALSLPWPMHLSVDTDLGLLPGATDSRALLGFAFVLAAIVLCFWSSLRRSTRPIAFGMGWFLLASVPTAVTPLAEVANDHRVYFPFVGLVLAACWILTLGLTRLHQATLAWPAAARRSIWVAPVALLPFYAWGVSQRNTVWKSDESLWRDATEKSPLNGRAWMNYGLTQMAKGEYPRALETFERAARLLPAYATLEVNLGVVHGALRHPQEAERHFLRAVMLAPAQASARLFYARWLRTNGRADEAIAHLQSAVSSAPYDFEARYSLMEALFERKQWKNLERAVADAGRVNPNDDKTRQWAQKSQSGQRDEVALAEARAAREPNADALLELSFVYFKADRFRESIDAARAALEVRPSFAEAYNNIGSAYASMGQWMPAIEAARKALELRPGFALAENNLRWAEAMKSGGAARQP